MVELPEIEATHAVNDADRDWLYRTVKRLQPRVAVEIGSFLGRSTTAIVAALPEGGELYAVDPWKFGPKHDDAEVYRQFQANIAATPRAEGVVVHPMQMTSVQFEAAYDGPVDFCCVDGTHTRSGVALDLLLWTPRAGFFCGHDIITEEGVIRACLHFAASFGYHLTVHSDNMWVMCKDRPLSPITGHMGAALEA